MLQGKRQEAKGKWQKYGVLKSIFSLALTNDLAAFIFSFCLHYATSKYLMKINSLCFSL